MSRQRPRGTIRLPMDECLDQRSQMFGEKCACICVHFGLNFFSRSESRGRSSVLRLSPENGFRSGQDDSLSISSRGRSSAWLERLPVTQEVASSSLVGPAQKESPLSGGISFCVPIRAGCVSPVPSIDRSTGSTPDYALRASSGQARRKKMPPAFWEAFFFLYRSEYTVSRLPSEVRFSGRRRVGPAYNKKSPPVGIFCCTKWAGVTMSRLPPKSRRDAGGSAPQNENAPLRGVFHFAIDDGLCLACHPKPVSQGAGGSARLRTSACGLRPSADKSCFVGQAPQNENAPRGGIFVFPKT
jgi:hypothetical protein